MPADEKPGMRELRICMPELSWRYGYEVALLAMGALDGYLFYRLRKAKWL